MLQLAHGLGFLLGFGDPVVLRRRTPAWHTSQVRAVCTHTEQRLLAAQVIPVTMQTRAEQHPFTRRPS